MWVVRCAPRISAAHMQRDMDMHILESFIWGFYIIAGYNLRPTNLEHADAQMRILQCWIVQCWILQNRTIRCGILQCGFYIDRYYKSKTAGLWIMNPNPHLPVLHIWGSYNLGSINAGCFNVGSCDVGFYKIRATIWNPSGAHLFCTHLDLAVRDPTMWDTTMPNPTMWNPTRADLCFWDLKPHLCCL